MSWSRAGVKQIGFADAGSLLSTPPTHPLVLGLRGPGTMLWKTFKEVKDYRERVLPNMINFNIKAESLQPTMLLLNQLITWLNLGADIQVITQPQTTGGSPDIYQFTPSSNQLGIDFELLITQDKRALTVTLEGATEQANAIITIDAADTNTAVTLAGATGDGADFSKYRAPFFLAFQSPKATPLFNKGDLIARSYTIKTKSSQKNIYNVSVIDYLTVTLMLQTRNASVANQLAQLNSTLGTSVYVQETNASGNYDAFDFNAGVLTQMPEYEDQDKSRNLKVTYAADIPLGDISWLFGTGNGGGAADAGLTGGTMKVGY
jgi:hypothetical protein